MIMELKKERLANGLDIIGEVNQSAKSTAVGFFVKNGSRDETEQINGVSHFLEHMIFKGTERLNAIEVSQAFDRTGAQYNAFTSEENTVFYAAVLPEYLQEVTQLWIELMRPALREEDFNIEKNVIKEEIAMYKDLPSFDVLDRCRTLHFGRHPCGNSVLGSEQSIDGVSCQQMRNYFAKRYSPNNVVLAFAGNFNWQEVLSIADKHCSKWQEQVVERRLEHYTGSKKKERLEKPNLVREHICLMSTGVSAQDERRFAASLFSVIVGDNVGSRYYWELVDKALAETATMQFGAMDGTGIFCSYVRCGSVSVPMVMNTIGGIFEDLLKNGIAEGELTKAKNKVLSALVIKNELPMGRLVDLGFNWTYLREYRTVQDDINAVRAVTVENINSLIEQLNPGDFTQFSLGPSKSG
jgi:predicted Zn-dependent peptidase